MLFRSLVQLAWWVAKGPVSAAPAASDPASTRGLALLLFKDFLLPFELTSILILIAILGAIVLAKKEPV